MRHHGLGAAILQHIGDLRRLAVPVHRHAIGADALRGKARLEERKVVAQHHGDGVAGADAELGKAGRGPRRVLDDGRSRYFPLAAQHAADCYLRHGRPPRFFVSCRRAYAGFAANARTRPREPSWLGPSSSYPLRRAGAERGMSILPRRHARPCAGHPRLYGETWMAGTSPAMTDEGTIIPDASLAARAAATLGCRASRLAARSLLGYAIRFARSPRAQRRRARMVPLGHRQPEA